MTVAVRVIPCLDVANGRVVKGISFESLRDAGDPVEAAVRYEGEGADELAFLDIAAAHEKRGTLVELASRVAEVLSIPFTVGGGVRSVEDADALLRAGADRVTVNTAAVEDPSLITRLGEQFGAQCVVVAIDGKRMRDASGLAVMRVMTHGGRRPTDRSVTGWAAAAAAAGAGEILLTSVDADGTQAGFDLEMLRAVRAAVDIPIVASGGAGQLDDFAKAVVIGGADAVLAASVFHDRIFTIGAVKEAMRRAGLAIRPAPARVRALLPRYDASGLVPVVMRDVVTGNVLTLAWANAEALAKDARDRPRALLQPLAQGALEEGRDVGKRPARRRDLPRLRRRRRALRRAPVGARPATRARIRASRAWRRLERPVRMRGPRTRSTSRLSSRSSRRGRSRRFPARTRTSSSKPASRASPRKWGRKPSRRRSRRSPATRERSPARRPTFSTISRSS